MLINSDLISKSNSLLVLARNYVASTNMKRIYTLCKLNEVQFTYNTMQSQFMSLGGQPYTTDWAFPQTVASDKRWRRNSASRRSPLIGVVK